MRAAIRGNRSSTPVSGLPASAFPVVDARESIASMTNRVSEVPLRRGGWLWWWIALAPSVALLGVGVIGVGWAFWRGIR
ncbi:MAG TPA: hypothetical protein VGL95_16835, partial [Acetobacteraceae bacterium]